MAGSDKHIPYGRQSISQEDIDAVSEVLRSDWLTTGPMVPKFEATIAELSGAAHAVAVSSGTSALHSAMYAAGVGPGDEVIVPSLTFAASANAVVYQGGSPVLVDIGKQDLLIDPAEVEKRIGPRTKAVVAVDYAGQPCDYEALGRLCQKKGLVLIADACHSIGGNQRGQKVGTLADLSCFSFHPVKHLTTAEGGMIVTQNQEFAKRMRLFRNHGINTDHRERAEKGMLHYEMIDLGYNYRLNDVQCALGLSQARRLQGWVERRNAIARRYDEAFAKDRRIEPVTVNPGNYHAYHLYVVKLAIEEMSLSRDQVFQEMRKRNIGVNCHYPPVHMHPYYQRKFGTKTGDLPKTEWAYQRILSLPMYPDLRDAQVDLVINSLRELAAK